MHRIPILAIACFVACLSHSARASAQHFDHSYAIVIGIDSYEHSNTWPTLHYAAKDAKAITDFLRSQEFTVIPLYGPDAKKAAIIAAMEDDLAPKLLPGDRVLFFFAGHGKTETLGGKEEGYIVPYDGNSDSSLISMSELRSQSSYMGNARHQLFIMDSCYGGLLAATRDSIVDIHRPHYLEVVTGRLARQVLTAGGKGQTVLDGGPKGHSVFVDALLEALEDGMADLNGDGYITFHELVAYVTPRASNDYETPGAASLPDDQEGEFVFRNPKGPGRSVAEIPVPASTARRSNESVATPEQHVALGDARFGVSDWDGAAAEYRKAIGVNPADAEAHLDLGVALEHKWDWDGEIKEEREAIRLKPDYAEAYADLGVALWGKLDLDGDIKAQREAIRLKPDYAYAHRSLGLALSSKGDWDEGIKEEREAVRLQPDLALSHLFLGMALEHKGDWDGEVKEELEAIRLQSDLATAHFFLGRALEHKGDRQSALAEYRRTLELQPGYTMAAVFLDNLLKNQGNFSSN
jgi:tetratricopeptide (TPR) repeat protein